MAILLRLMRDEHVALTIAEVLNIYDGCGVGGNELQDLAGFEVLQALARFQHGKRAQKAGGIEFIFHHPATIARPPATCYCDALDGRQECRF